MPIDPAPHANVHALYNEYVRTVSDALEARYPDAPATVAGYTPLDREGRFQSTASVTLDGRVVTVGLRFTVPTDRTEGTTKCQVADLQNGYGSSAEHDLATGDFEPLTTEIMTVARERKKQP